MVRDAIKKL